MTKPKKVPWGSRGKPFRLLGAHGVEVLLDHHVAYELLEERRCTVRFDPETDLYPSVYSPTGTVVCRLHEWVWDYYNGNDRPRRQGFEVDHIDKNKLNNTIRNLRLLSKPGHSKRHLLEKQQFSKRKKNAPDKTASHKPGPVKVLMTSEKRQLIESGQISPPPPSTKKPSTLNPVKVAEKKLEMEFHRLDLETAHLDDGKPIPKVNTRTKPRDRLLRISSIRRGLTLAEASAFRALAKHGMWNLEGAAKDVGVELQVFKKIADRPALAVHIERWNKGHLRLPPVSSNSD